MKLHDRIKFMLHVLRASGVWCFGDNSTQVVSDGFRELVSSSSGPLRIMFFLKHTISEYLGSNCRSYVL